MGRPVDPHEETKAESIRPGQLSAGTTIGGYALVDVLGEGGMGVVWRAHDPNLDREIAIKVLRRHDGAPELRKRLLREGRAMARLKHPNVLTVYEVGTDGARDFIAMELVEGSSLDIWLARTPPPDEVMKALLAAGRGLAAAHAAGLVHRDFKPHNVLRSRDGRVLVTDFGLARGLGDDSASGVAETTLPPAASHNAMDVTLEAASGNVRTDSLLDSPMTKTGAMIGTPAYMAPEQFAGSMPDPRTDQFAFCVTAWQALTGARPFTGNSIDELRKSASEGVAKVRADLPPGMRAVLARGLDPDPSKRWPNLDALLEALEALQRPRTPRWVVVALATGVLVTIALVLVLRFVPRAGAPGAAAASVCEPADTALADAWSPELRSALVADFEKRNVGVSESELARVLDPLDDFRKDWIASYDQACRGPAAKLNLSRIGCLLGVRDELSTLHALVQMGSPERFAAFDPHGMLPNLAACAAASPIAPPAIPADKRRRVIAVLANAIGLSGTPNFAQKIARLEEEAADIGWQPLFGLLRMSFGNEYLRRGEVANAREQFDRALADAKESNDPRAKVNIQLGLLEASLAELEDPGKAGKPGGLHPEIAARLVHARVEIKAAGNDPMLAASLALIEAQAYREHAHWNTAPRSYDKAIELATAARTGYEQANDLRRAAFAAVELAEIYIRRGDPRAIDDAVFATRAASEALERARLRAVGPLEEMRARLELLRGQYAEAQHRYQALARPRPAPAGELITGRVVDANKQPVANARVVVWTGELDGDPKAVVTDVRTLQGELVETSSDGTFSIHARSSDAVIAEHRELRSTPRTVGTAPLELRLEPTNTAAAAVDEPTPIELRGYFRFVIGAHAWNLLAPVDRGGSLQIGGMPDGAQASGLVATVGHGLRLVKATPGPKLRWPRGDAIEVIVRAAVEPDAAVWVFRGTVAPRTRAEADAVMTRADDVAFASLRPIGADTTDAGREVYQRGDQHAVIAGNAPGPVTVCAAPGGAATSAVWCKTWTIKAQEPAGVTAILLPENAR